MKRTSEHLPPCLTAQRDTLAGCLEAMDRALPLRAVHLFGSHARGKARLDSHVDRWSAAFAASAVPLCTALNEVHFTDRHPGFDLDGPDWRELRAGLEQVTALLATVQTLLAEE